MARRILVVDDEPDFCEAISDFLVEKGYQVRVANNGTDALSAYKLERHDVVLLDVEMPGISGLETLRELKAIDPDVCVIIVTGVLEKGLHRMVMTEGAFDYITKPFNFDRLELAIKTKILLHNIHK